MQRQCCSSHAWDAELKSANYVQMAHSPNIILAKFSRYTVATKIPTSGEIQCYNTCNYRNQYVLLRWNDKKSNILPISLVTFCFKSSYRTSMTSRSSGQPIIQLNSFTHFCILSFTKKFQFLYEPECMEVCRVSSSGASLHPQTFYPTYRLREWQSYVYTSLQTGFTLSNVNSVHEL